MYLPESVLRSLRDKSQAPVRRSGPNRWPWSARVHRVVAVNICFLIQYESTVKKQLYFGQILNQTKVHRLKKSSVLFLANISSYLRFHSRKGVWLDIRISFHIFRRRLTSFGLVFLVFRSVRLMALIAVTAAVATVSKFSYLNLLEDESIPDRVSREDALLDHGQLLTIGNVVDWATDEAGLLNIDLKCAFNVFANIISFGHSANSPLKSNVLLSSIVHFTQIRIPELFIREWSNKNTMNSCLNFVSSQLLLSL